MLIRNAVLTDIEEIQKVAAETWRSTYDNIIPLNIQNSFINHAYSKGMLQERINQGFFFVALLENKVIGFLNYSSVKNNEAELVAFYILSNYQRKNIGSKLLEEMLRDLNSNTDIVCEVETDNQLGKNFYLKKGFVEESVYNDDFLGHSLSTTKMRLHRN